MTMHRVSKFETGVNEEDGEAMPCLVLKLKDGAEISVALTTGQAQEIGVDLIKRVGDVEAAVEADESSGGRR